MSASERFFVLSNGIRIPSVGFGTSRIPRETTAASVAEAIRDGYRLIDNAFLYKNEREVGTGIKDSGIDRRELFVTSKVWNTERGYDKSLRAFDLTLSALGLDYLDLYLIHWPANPSQFDNWKELNKDTWKALVSLYKEGRVRSIGVSNFLPKYLDLLLDAEVAPMVNQFESHPGHLQEELIRYCQSRGIVVEAWRPLGAGKLLTDPALGSIAAKYGKDPAQVCIRFALQRGVVSIPKSSNPERIRSNLDVFDFELTAEEMQAISRIHAPESASGLHPDTVDF